MKPLFTLTAAITAAALISTAAQADGRRHHAVRHAHHGVHHHGAGWVVPVVIGGVIAYTLADSARSAPHDTRIVRVEERYVPLYEERWEYFGDCDCKRRVLVKIR
ncbi:MAG: hypothetical protein AB7U26_05140 [Sulfuricurvum sp.]|jgi:hypothetical protein|nr:hypothetical protein [Sulfuricurvum sp.]